MDLIKYSNANFKKNELIINDSITIEEWKELGQSLKQVEGSVQFWIGDWARFGDKKGFTGKYVDSKVYDELEEITGLDRRTIQDYKTVADRVPSAGRHADLSFSQHREVAALPEAKQVEFLTRASEEKLSVRELRDQIRKESNIERIADKMTDGVFDIIYADPPWRYDMSISSNRDIENQYPTMDIDDICKMQLPAISENALLIMWATAPKLLEAFRVIEAWGFEYKTNSIWDKEKIGMGYWFRGQHEILMIATRGNYPPPSPDNRESSVFREARGKHSAKPDYYYEWIERSFTGNKIELFARNTRPGWKSWGNDI